MDTNNSQNFVSSLSLEGLARDESSVRRCYLLPGWKGYERERDSRLILPIQKMK